MTQAVKIKLTVTKQTYKYNKLINSITTNGNKIIIQSSKDHQASYNDHLLAYLLVTHTTNEFIIL